MRNFLLAVLGLLALAIFAFAFYGGFHKVVISEAEIGPFFMVYESNKGPYKQTGASVHKLMEFAKENGIAPIAGYGMYFDDPRLVAESELHSEAGILVSGADIETLRSKLGVFQSKQFPKTLCVASEFPLRGFPSIMLGVWKVYPKLMKTVEDKKMHPGASLEIYEIDKNRTVYAMPIGS
jgi:effector-binding domain-containing protein